MVVIVPPKKIANSLDSVLPFAMIPLPERLKVSRETDSGVVNFRGKNMFNAENAIAAEIASTPEEYPAPLNFRERILAVESPVARELLLAGYDDFAGVIEFPNEYLPEHLWKKPNACIFRNMFGRRKEKGFIHWKHNKPFQTVAEIGKRIEKLSRREEANRRKKAAHAEEINRRVELYEAQIQSGQKPNKWGNFMHSPNEIQFEEFVYDPPESRKPRSLSVQ